MIKQGINYVQQCWIRKIKAITFCAIANLLLPIRVLADYIRQFKLAGGCLNIKLWR